MASLEKRPFLHLLKPYVNVFDGPLMLIVILILMVGTVTLYSAGIDFPGRIEGHVRNIALSLLVMWVAALVPPQVLMRFAVPLYVGGIVLLLAVAQFGLIRNGAQRDRKSVV